jgi:hypothetical protein
MSVAGAAGDWAGAEEEALDAMFRLWRRWVRSLSINGLSVFLQVKPGDLDVRYYVAGMGLSGLSLLHMTRTMLYNSG